MTLVSHFLLDRNISKYNFMFNDSNMYPLVSVVMPIFNGSKYLCESIDSILSQTYKNIEIILIDDGSTDSTSEICLFYVRSNSNVFYYYQNNSGISSALNLGIAKARGSYIARMDSDDICIRERISLQVDFFLNNPNCYIVSCGYYPFFENLNVLEPIIHPSNSDIIKLLLCYCSPVTHPGAIFRSEVFSQFSYDSNSAAEDHELWTRVGNVFEIGNIELPLIHYRRSNNSLSATNRFKIKFSTLKNGFKFFINNRASIRKIKFIDIYKNSKNFPRIRWWPSYLYIFIARFF